MAKTVWKFPIPITDKFTLEIPERPKFLAMQNQEGKLVAWFEVNADNWPKSYLFAIIGTGNPIPHAHIHLSTVQQNPFVWHLYTFECSDLLGL